MYLWATAIGDKRADPFEWWRSNTKYYPNIDSLARDVHTVHASFVCIEEILSVARNLLDPLRTNLYYESIWIVTVFGAWNRIFGSMEPINLANSISTEEVV